VTDGLSWLGILRLGLVQAALGSIVVLTTSTLNRVMVVELAMPALLPGLLVGMHYMVQLMRPRMGFGSDVGGRRTPWIVGGMVVLAIGGTGAAAATAWMATAPTAGIALAVLSFFCIGLGVSAGGTSLLVLLAKQVRPDMRAPAATIVWMMMIVGFAVTAGVASKLLDPYSPARLLAVVGGVCSAAVALTLVALRGVERNLTAAAMTPEATPPRFREALAEVWQEPAARRMTIFVFVSMLAFSAQDLILEPFAGVVFGYTPGQSTGLSGIQNAGVLAGMIAVAAAGGPWARGRLGTLRGWAVGGCIASALALFGLVAAGSMGPGWPLDANVFALGAANGAFSIAAIGSMMNLAGHGRERREGVRMGLWGAAQALAFGLGGVVGTGASDLARALIGSQGAAYASVFALEGLLFLLSARLALRIDSPTPAEAPRGAVRVSPVGDPQIAIKHR
jgi:BCD family chlorophyll transporter-like MFS transporter